MYNKQLEIKDLYDYDLLMIHHGWSNHMDQLRDDFYDTNIFNRCENTEDI